MPSSQKVVADKSSIPCQIGKQFVGERENESSPPSRLLHSLFSSIRILDKILQNTENEKNLRKIRLRVWIIYFILSRGGRVEYFSGSGRVISSFFGRVPENFESGTRKFQNCEY